jgi:hypothetical protein
VGTFVAAQECSQEDNVELVTIPPYRILVPYMADRGGYNMLTYALAILRHI